MMAVTGYQAGNTVSAVVIIALIVFNIALWMKTETSFKSNSIRSTENSRVHLAERSLPDIYKVEPHIIYDDFPDKSLHPLFSGNTATYDGRREFPEASTGDALKKVVATCTKGSQPDAYVGMFGKILTQSAKSMEGPPTDYTELRKTYQVPTIRYPRGANCQALLSGDKGELKKAEQFMRENPKVPVTEERYRKDMVDCEAFKTMRGYVMVPLTQDEEDYPLAFSIAMYRDIEQAERLLRAVYQPQNIYCIHIDTKASLNLHMAMYQMAGCFHNVFITSHMDRIKWGDISVLLPAMDCMRDMVKYHRGKWKYFINLTGQEMPLRTNWELVQIAKIFNGSNDIGGSKYRLEMDRVHFRWSHRYGKRYEKTITVNTYELKEPNPFNLTYYKGELHGLFAHKMVEYIIESNVALRYLDWCWDTGHPTEHYWNTLNYNRKLLAPGGYEGPDDVAHLYSLNQVSRAKHWIKSNYDSRICRGAVVRGICVYGVNDLPWLHKRQELVANKFHLDFEYLAYDCMEERHRNRTMMRDNVPFDKKFYQNLPTVKYSRKDGL